MCTITIELNNEDMLKLRKRASRAGMSEKQAAEMIAKKGVQFFLGFLVGATKSEN